METTVIKARDGPSFESAKEQASAPSAQRQPTSVVRRPAPQVSSTSSVLPREKVAGLHPRERQHAAAPAPSAPQNSATSLVVPRGKGARTVAEGSEEELEGSSMEI